MATVSSLRRNDDGTLRHETCTEVIHLTPQELRSRAEDMLTRHPPATPVWFGDDGWLRRGHSLDLTEMLERLGVRTSAQ